MQSILEWDKRLMFSINGAHNQFFDTVLPWVRHSKNWLPLYILIVVFVIYKFRKQGLWWVLFAVCCVILSNYISSDLVKENIWRTRPCRDPLLNSQLTLFPNIYCPSSSSFTSSHATNHFGMAAYIFFTGRKAFGKWLALFFFWAFIIVYAQIYIGVHYPLDVLAGGMLGTLVGYTVARIHNKRFGILTFDN